MNKTGTMLLSNLPVFCAAMFMSTFLLAADLTISSSSKPTTMLELYTSQGCSSCPPAEKWLSKFTSDERLWTEVVPINFHVDYWDYLGWKDPFALPEFSVRQRLYAEKGHARTVGTPGFIVDGRGWTGWFRPAWRKNIELPQASISPVRRLKAIVRNETIEVSFDHKNAANLVVHVAILGFGIEENIRAGENRGEKLNHDFVVIGYNNNPVSLREKSGSNLFSLPRVVAVNPVKKGIVVWVSRKNDPAPLQVAGNWL